MPALVRRRRLQLLIVILFALASLAPSGQPALAQGGQHVVSPGETLFRIALRYGVSVDALASANGIYNTARIYAGQVLVIPTGNPAPVPAVAAAVPAAAPGDGLYTVQPGDTLNRIAQRFGMSVQGLMALNGIYDPNRILVGQQLRISGAAPAVPAAPAAPAPAPAPGGERTHVVQRGEGLAQIGRQYGISWPTLAAYNGLANPNLIYAGMVLRIPDSDMAPGSVAANPAGHAAPIATGKAILVILREQMVYAFQDGQLVRSTLASTGLPGTPTVQGDFRIYVKYRSQTMSGPGYRLPNVPFVMYFYQGYGLHGTYWHNNFGRPMSRGCVNLPTPEAEWYFNFAEVGTPVYVRW